MKNLNSYIEEAIDNVRSDRDLAATLLQDIMQNIQKDSTQHKDSGPVAAKYLETLQRSNEQLVKLSGLIQKKDAANNEFTNIDKEAIFDILKESDNG